MRADAALDGLSALSPLTGLTAQHILLERSASLDQILKRCYLGRRAAHRARCQRGPPRRPVYHRHASMPADDMLVDANWQMVSRRSRDERPTISRNFAAVARQ